MKTSTSPLKIGFTLLVALAAIWVAWEVWAYYTQAPWTRDGKVRADTIALAPEVSGRVIEVLVKDNAKVVAGQVLFRVDTSRLEIALKRAEASIMSTQAVMNAAQREAGRYGKLSGVVSEEVQKQKTTAA